MNLLVRLGFDSVEIEKGGTEDRTPGCAVLHVQILIPDSAAEFPRLTPFFATLHSVLLSPVLSHFCSTQIPYLAAELPFSNISDFFSSPWESQEQLLCFENSNHTIGRPLGGYHALECTIINWPTLKSTAMIWFRTCAICEATFYHSGVLIKHDISSTKAHKDFSSFA